MGGPLEASGTSRYLPMRTPIGAISGMSEYGCAAGAPGTSWSCDRETAGTHIRLAMAMQASIRMGHLLTRLDRRRGVPAPIGRLRAHRLRKAPAVPTRQSGRP